MRLEKVEIEGYRSITQRVEVIFDPKVTVVLGANDHGKTNILDAIYHLNEDNPLDEERDLSWDLHDSPNASNYPYISWTLVLTDEEKADFLDIENRYRLVAQSKAQSSKQIGEDEELEDEDSEDDSDKGDDEDEDEDDSAADDTEDEPIQKLEDFDLPDLTPISPKDIPEKLVLFRKGSASKLQAENADGLIALPQFLDSYLPRVELILPYDKIVDSIDAKGLEGKNPDSLFMRGIFYYAGLDVTDPKIFEQNARTERQLTEASRRLDETIRNNWSQGKNLKFILSHNSAKQRIELKIQDPAVDTRYVQPSRKSNGFTHFFALKTILNARVKDNKASSFIFLFDEPGIYLHPSGQLDLLQVLETLGKDNQIVYVTHSLFLINKTFPSRHRLISKQEGGTKIEGKPYTGRWSRTFDSLGLSLAGTILFANHILLTEGSSDTLYIPALLQKLAEAGKIDVDLNSFSVMPTDDPENAAILIRMLLNSRPVPKIVVLFDGDKGGLERYKALKKLLDEQEISHETLDKDLVLEDYLFHKKELYVEAVANYLYKLPNRKNSEDDQAQNLERFKQHYTDSKRDGKATMSDWANEASDEIANIKRPSKIGIAREYVSTLQDLPNSDLKHTEITKGTNLLTRLIKALELPKQTLDQENILEVSNSDL